MNSRVNIVIAERVKALHKNGTEKLHMKKQRSYFASLTYGKWI